MTKFITRFFKDESGATAIEYALIAGGIAVAVVGAVAALSPEIEAAFTDVGTYVGDNATPQ